MKGRAVSTATFLTECPRNSHATHAETIRPVCFQTDKPTTKSQTKPATCSNMCSCVVFRMPSEAGKSDNFGQFRPNPNHAPPPAPPPPTNRGFQYISCLKPRPFNLMQPRVLTGRSQGYAPKAKGA